MTEHNRIIDIAARISDRESVDWSQEMEQTGTEGDTGVLNNLRLLQDLAGTLDRQAAEKEAEDLIRYLDESFDAQFQAAIEADVPPPSHWGALEVRERIGAGASSDIYRAWDPALEREVALKLFRSSVPAASERLLKEGRQLARIDHPAVLRVLGAEEHDGRVGLWSELVAGQNLQQQVESSGALAVEKATDIGMDLAAALAAVHRTGVIHRDVKAQNVMRTAEGRTVLTDFGSGIEMAETDSTPLFSGTPLYLAPEVLAGGPATVASDVYGLGVLLYYLVSGTYPVQADNLEALRGAHRLGSPSSLAERNPRLPKAFCAVVDRAVSPDPVQRFEDMNAFRDALAGLSRPAYTGHRIPWLAAAAVLLLAAFLWLRPTPEPSFMIDSALYRVTQEGQVALSDGAQVSLGDRLSLMLTTDTSLYVYVFNEDQAGNAHGLFPLTWLTQKNPLPPGAGHELPGLVGSQNMAWQVDSAGGLEKIHIIASPEPLADLEALYAELPPATLANPVLTQRGIGSVAPVGPTVSATPLVQAARQLTGQSSETTGAWFHTIELQGPAPQ